MNHKNVFIIDYAYGFNAKTCEPDYIARMRLQAGMRAFKKYPEAHIILSAGMKEATGDCGPLAEMMKNFLIEKGIEPQKIFLNPKGHDTLTETEAAYKIIKEQGGGKIICATSIFHAPRVWLIWLFRFGRVPIIYTSHLKPHWSEYLQEFIQIPSDIIRSFFKALFK